MTFSLALEALLISCMGLLFWYLYTRTAARKTDRLGLTGGLPDPDPLHDFDIVSTEYMRDYETQIDIYQATATTRNHLYVNKVVRFPYYQTMSHQPMDTNNWIEIDKDLKWYIEQKTRVIEEQGKNVIDSLPENDAGCGELMEILVDYLPKRYPTLFEKIDCKGGGIWNKVTDEKLVGLEGKVGVDALLVCSRLVEDDFLMGREREDGHVYFTGGLVAFPGFYLLSKKINKSLRIVHDPVPYFNEKILFSVERKLKRFQPNEPFERTSWEIVDDRDLFFHNIARIESDGKELSEKQHPKDLYFRVDHQTFRKLPKTKAIIFGVHPIMKRLEDLADSPLVPALLAKVHEEGDRKIMDYKLAPLYQERMLPYLHELAAQQIEKGLVRYACPQLRLFH
ncbi:hypothetical protein DFH11DRAFT_1688264 [Phellopilus nigrolimitatus]|nr:hypothetical protein DFH11DRAFT_1688264 [Phellopilus nigrolimitatus]